MVSKAFEKPLNNSLVDHLEKCGLFSYFQYGFRSSQLTSSLLTVISDKVTRAFNRSAATSTVALDIPKAFGRVWHAGLLLKLKFYGISGQILSLILSFLSNRLLRVVMRSPYKNIQLMLEFLKAPFLVLHFSYYTLMAFLMIAINADDTTLYAWCDQASDL